MSTDAIKKARILADNCPRPAFDRLKPIFDCVIMEKQKNQGIATGCKVFLSWLSDEIKVVKPPVLIIGGPTDQKVRGSNPLPRANPDT